MTLSKGYARLSVRKSVQDRLDRIRRLMELIEPEKYDETTSYSAVITWMLDDVSRNHSKELEKLA